MIELVPEEELVCSSGNRWERILVRTVYSMAVAGRPFSTYRLPTVREFVRLTGASLVTVTRVFNELDGLGLIFRKHGSGYYPKREVGVADLLELVRPRRLAFILSSLRDEANYQRYDLFFFIQRRLAQIHGAIEFCLKADLLKAGDIPDYDGFFVLSPNRELVAKLQPRAMVCVGNYPNLPSDYVGTQLEHGCSYMVELMLREGRGDLCVMISDGNEERLGLEMAELLEAELKPHGVRVGRLFCGSQDGYEGVKQWLRTTGGGSAILTMHCKNTGDAIRACENMDLRIGEEVKLVAWGSANVAMRSICDFFVLRSDREVMANELLRLLLLRILNPKASLRRVELPTLAGSVS